MALALAETMQQVRQRTLDLVAHLSPAELERQIDPIMSPLVWDLAHIAAYEDLWLVHRFAGAPLLRPDLAARYDAFETPRTVRGEIELLDAAGAQAYLTEVRERVLETLDEREPDPVLHEMVLRHELQHTETMRQAMELGGVLPAGEPALRPLASDRDDEWITIPAGPFRMGAGPDVFAYDNERTAHLVDLHAFRIARRPVTNGTWMHFAEGGGYERREWWSDEGWAWKEDYDITHHAGVAAGAPDAPACHVSWFEADAFARAHGARLPTEAEWEKAATWDQEPRPPRRSHLTDPVHGNGPPRGALEASGQVWEWTASPFTGYPGFVAHPYPQYSEVFFGDRYKVLRGGSWATAPRVATPTFRNWDLPQRRQIFAGVRLAREA
jgi:gamma-glutamyl hercynylcysteine S-oxide synthase